MLFLKPHEASKLRCQILRDLQLDSYVEIDSRFVKPLFGGTSDMRRWCETWSLTIDTFTRSGMFHRDKTPIEWVSFKYPEPEQIVII